MESIMAPQLRRNSDHQPGFHLSFRKSTILQAVGCKPGGSDQSTLSGCDASGLAADRRGKRQAVDQGCDRLLHFAEKILIPERPSSGGNPDDDSRSIFRRWSFSILSIADYAGRKRGIVYQSESTTRLGTIMPITDGKGRGFSGPVL